LQKSSWRSFELERAASVATVAIVALVSAAAASAQVPAFSKSFDPSTIGPGSASTLVYVVDTTSTPSPVTGLAFVDTLPAGVVIATPSRVATTCLFATVTGPAGGSTIALSQGRLGTGSSCTVTIDVTSSAPGSHPSISGDLTSSAGNSGTAQDTLTVDTARPGFSMAFAPPMVAVGAVSQLTFSIDNSANAAALATISFTAELPVGLAIASPAGASTDCGNAISPATLTAEAGTRAISLFASGSLPNFPVLGPGETCSVSIDVAASVAGVFDFASGVLTADNSLTTGKAVASLAVERRELQKSFVGSPAFAGDTVQLVYTLTNLNRTYAASDIAFSDDLGAALAGLTTDGLPPVTPCGPGSSVSGTTVVSFSGGQLGPGASCAFSLNVAVPSGAAPGDYLSTTGSASLLLDGQEKTWDAAAARLRVVDQPFAFTKTFLTNPVGAGSSAMIRFSITNQSSMSAANEIAFTDEIAPPLGFPVTFDPFPVTPCGMGSSLATVSTGFDRQGFALRAGTLPPGGTCQFDVGFAIPVDIAAGSFALSTQPITAMVGMNPVDGGSATDTLVVVAAPLQFSAEFIDDPAAPAQTVTLQFVLVNDSEAGDAIDGLGFSDELTSTISGLAASALPADGFCGAGSQISGTTTLSVSGASLSAGQMCAFSVVLSVPADAPPGRFANTTSNVSGSVNGIAVLAPAAAANLDITGLVLSKAFVDDPVVPGDPVVLEYTIRNDTAALTASSIAFTDNLSATLNGLIASSGVPATPCGPASSFVMIGTTLIFQGGALAPGASCSFSVILVVPGSAVSTDYASATGNLTATLGGAPVVFPGASDILMVGSAPNDLCTEATVVDLASGPRFIDTQNTRIASADPGDPAPGCSVGQDGATVWYSWIATDTQTVQVGTEGSSYDTVVSVWQGTGKQCGALMTEVACNDDLGPGVPASLAEFESVSGTSYLIQVGARTMGDGGDLVVSIPEPAAWWARVSVIVSLAGLRRMGGRRRRAS